MGQDTENTEKIDHKAKARRALAGLPWAPTGQGQEERRVPELQTATVHALLAIAEGQERVAEEIKAFREDARFQHDA